jgi:hypothetical protein
MSLSSQFSTYEIARVIASVADTVAIAQLLPSSSVSVIGCGGITRLRVTALTAVITQVGLITPTASGTPTGAGTIQPVNVSNKNIGLGQISPVRFIEAWAAAPTYAGTPVYMRRGYLPATIGAFFEWEWPEDDPFQVGLRQASLSSSLVGAVLRNITGGASAQLLVEARLKVFANVNGLNT